MNKLFVAVDVNEGVPLPARFDLTNEDGLTETEEEVYS